MDQDDLDKETQNTLIRLLRHLPQPKSNMRVEILVGHIAVEELAWKLLVKKLPNPAVFARTNLPTRQLIRLLESLHAREPIEWFWKLQRS